MCRKCVLLASEELNFLKWASTSNYILGENLKADVFSNNLYESAGWEHIYFHLLRIFLAVLFWNLMRLYRSLIFFPASHDKYEITILFCYENALWLFKPKHNSCVTILLASLFQTQPSTQNISLEFRKAQRKICHCWLLRKSEQNNLSFGTRFKIAFFTPPITGSTARMTFSGVEI